MIITKSISRFARNTVDTLTTVRNLKEKGIEVYFEKKYFYTLKIPINAVNKALSEGAWCLNLWDTVLRNTTINTLVAMRRLAQNCTDLFLRVLKNSHLRDILILISANEKWGRGMAVSYKKLFHLLIEKDMTNAQLQQEAGFSANIITRMKRGGYISLESVESICCALNCGVDDILEFVPEDNGGKENG